MDNAGFVADGAPGYGATTNGHGQASRTAASRTAAAAARTEAELASIRRRQQKEAQLASSVQLPRTIGAVSGSAILIGSIVGAGIFISPAGVLRHAGSPGAALLIWLACGLVEAVGALVYIELGLLLPEHGGDFTYLLRAFGPLHKFLGELPAFLQCWLDVNVTNPAGSAVLALTFAQYCVRPFYGQCAPPTGLESVIAVFVVMTLTATNCVGVHWSTRLQTASMFAKITAMSIIVVGGVYSLAQGNVQYISEGFEGTSKNAGDMAAAFFTCLWAYGGWKNLNNITEEVKNPPRNLPLSILGSLPIVTLFYLLVNVAYLAVLSPDQMLSSPAVAFTFGALALGPAAFLMPLGVALSVFGTLNGAALAGSRIQLAVARRGHHMYAFSLVHMRWLTPVPALLFQGTITCIMVLIGDVGALLRLGGFVGAMFSVLVHVALFVLRRTMSDSPRPYRVPTVLAALRLLFSVYLLVAPLVQQKPRAEYLYSLVMVVLGLAVYVPCVYRRWSHPLLARGTIGLQKALELLPTSSDFDQALELLPKE